MTPIQVTLALALLALAAAASTADAQQSSEGAILETCQGESGGSRARRNGQCARASPALHLRRSGSAGDALTRAAPISR
jgi:hypothetical protein